ncbi:hypothetical protein E4U26_002124 [Claviceps purpurea]|nr:hypothetical protein E4U26_002124 [Claviceps purpurea]
MLNRSSRSYWNLEDLNPSTHIEQHFGQIRCRDGEEVRQHLYPHTPLSSRVLPRKGYVHTHPVPVDRGIAITIYNKSQGCAIENAAPRPQTSRARAFLQGSPTSPSLV